MCLVGVPRTVERVPIRSQCTQRVYPPALEIVQLSNRGNCCVFCLLLEALKAKYGVGQYDEAGFCVSSSDRVSHGGDPLRPRPLPGVAQPFGSAFPQGIRLEVEHGLQNAAVLLLSGKESRPGMAKRC